MSGMSSPLQVVFVCWGNICRSPMAERVAEKMAADQGLTGVEFTSAGVSDEEHGGPMDSRARQWLDEHGYRSADHRAHQITAAEIDQADLVLAMEDVHLRRMRQMRPQRTDHLSLLTDFDPQAEPGSGIADPWYGSADGFGDTLRSVEAAMPGVLDKVRELAAD